MEAPLRPAERRALWPSLVLLAGIVAVAAVFVSYWTAPASLARVRAALLGVGTSSVLWGGLAGLAGLAALVLLLYRPAWLSLRLALARFGQRLNFDQKKAAELRARLVDFENAKDLTDLGRLYFEARRPQQALPVLARALELDPTPRAAMLVGECFAMLGQSERAAQILDQAIQSDPKIGFGSAVLTRARVAERIGATTDLARFARMHEELFGPNVQNLWLQAQAAHSAGEGEARQALLARLLEMDSGKLSLEDELVVTRARAAHRGAGGDAR